MIIFNKIFGKREERPKVHMAQHVAIEVNKQAKENPQEALEQKSFNPWGHVAKNYEERLVICRSCIYHEDLIGGAIKCKECGCVMQMKALFPGMKCPRDKW